MKHAITLMLCLLLFVVAACAEEGDAAFTIHSDVEFGMSLEEVAAKEAEHGFDAEPQAMTWVTYDEEGRVVEQTGEGLVVRGSVAGLEDSAIEYYFDAEGHLFEALYIFPEARNMTTRLLGSGLSSEKVDPHYADYEDISGLLADKYLPSSLEWTEDDPMISLIQDRAVQRFNEKNFYGATSTKLAASQTFLVPVEGAGRVYIQHVQATYSHKVNLQGAESLFNEYGHYLDYRMVTDEEQARLDGIFQRLADQAEADRIAAEEAAAVREKEIQEERNNDL